MALNHDPIEKISEVTSKLNGDASVAAPEKAQFDALMQQGTKAAPENLATAHAAPQAHVVDPAATQVKNVDPTKMDMFTLNKDYVTQSQEFLKKVEKATPLPTEDANIKKDFRPVMRNRLTHMEESLDSLQVALKNAGVEYTAPESKNNRNPIEQFLGNLEHAQTQMNNLGVYLEGMASSNKELSPANMLAIQIKVNHLQQELEFFTSLLNKALESTKTIMNVQV